MTLFPTVPHPKFCAHFAKKMKGTQIIFSKDKGVIRTG